MVRSILNTITNRIRFHDGEQFKPSNNSQSVPSIEETK